MFLQLQSILCDIPSINLSVIGMSCCDQYGHSACSMQPYPLTSRLVIGACHRLKEWLVCFLMHQVSFNQGSQHLGMFSVASPTCDWNVPPTTPILLPSPTPTRARSTHPSRPTPTGPTIGRPSPPLHRPTRPETTIRPILR